MARIAGIDLPRNKKIEFSLAYIYGIGPIQAKKILQSIKIDPNIKTDDLTELVDLGIWSFMESNQRNSAKEQEKYRRGIKNQEFEQAKIIRNPYHWDSNEKKGKDMEYLKEKVEYYLDIID